MTTIYLDHCGLSEPPFRITPQTAWFFAGAQRGALLDALLYAIENDEGIMKISGEVGTGKTMLCGMLIERLPTDAQVIYLTNPSLSPQALLQTVALELGIEDANSLTILRQIGQALIERYAAGRRIVIIIDEAHAMPAESLEQVRLLSKLEGANRKLLQIVLFGQPELDELLALREMRSLHDRITQHFSLAPLSEKEVTAYLQHRLEAAGYRGPDLFNRPAVRIMTYASKGLTRRINILADKTLMAAFAAKTRNVTRRHVRQAAADARYSLPPVKRFGAPLLAGVGIACAVAGIGLLGWHLLHAVDKPSAARPVVSVTKPAVAVPPDMPAASAPQATVAAATNVSAPVAAPTPAAPAPLVNTAGVGSATAALLEASRNRIAQSPSSHFFVQLQRVSASDAPSLEAFCCACGNRSIHRNYCSTAPRWKDVLVTG